MIWRLLDAIGRAGEALLAFIAPRMTAQLDALLDLDTDTPPRMSRRDRRFAGHCDRALAIADDANADHFRRWTAELETRTKENS